MAGHTPLSAVHELRSTDTRGSKGAGGRVVVGAGARMLIAGADAGWLRLFGFSAGEVVKRSSLRICCGPKTKIDTIPSLVERTAGAAPTWVTLYEKSGSEVVVVVRATCVEEGDDDANPQFAIEMLSVDWISGAGGNTEEDSAEKMADDTASLSLSSSCTGKSVDHAPPFSPSVPSLHLLPEPGGHVTGAHLARDRHRRSTCFAAHGSKAYPWPEFEPTNFKKGGRAHLLSFMAADRRRDCAGEVGEEKRFSRVRNLKSEKDEDVSS